MPNKSFRFIHAGDFHLEQPLLGVAEVPDHLRELFLDAPYAAARRVFDAALVEDADFVVLTGDILHVPSAGPRAMLFLLEQFARLGERGISVYWAGGQNDPPDAWPASIPLPKNVHVFSTANVAAFVHETETAPLARLLGVSLGEQRRFRPSDFAADPSGLYTIAVVHGTSDPALLQTRGVHYWALGGPHERSTASAAPATVHCCGTPQGRAPAESGVHGCTLVQVDAELQTRLSLIPTDGARWYTERVLIDDAVTRDELETRLHERMQTLTASAAGLPLLISWNIVGKGALANQLRRGALAANVLDSLRTEFGHNPTCAWSISLDAEMSDTLPHEWYEQETIRGDFLRAIRQLQMNPQESLDLEPYVAEAHQAGTLAADVSLDNAAAREAILREAARLGVELLSGEEAQA